MVKEGPLAVLSKSKVKEKLVEQYLAGCRDSNPRCYRSKGSVQIKLSSPSYIIHTVRVHIGKANLPGMES